MKLIYLEARKGILRKHVLIALILFLFLDILTISVDYRQGGIREVAGMSAGQRTGFATIYEKAKGPLTNENAGFVAGEYQRLSGEVADGTYSHAPQEGTYSGYIYGDYYLLGKYFYKPMSYAVQYAEHNRELLKQEADNLELYQSVGNKGMSARSAYILKHYEGRAVSAFYLTDGWESLLRYDFSDLLILLLLILGVASSFTREKETDMTMLLASSKRGGWPMIAAKCGSAVLYAATLTLLFSLFNLMAYGVLLGVDGWDMPLYAIEAYENTPFSGNIGVFYLLSCGMKAIGFSVMALVLLFLSSCFRRTLYPCILGVGAGAALSYCSGWATSLVWWKGLIAAISPLTLTRNWELWQSLSGDCLVNIYLPRFYEILLIQLILAVVVLWAVRRKSC